MMFFLACDLVSHRANLRGADRERTVSSLPGKVLQLRKHVMHPSAGVGLEVAQNVGKGLVRSQLCEDMHVVLSAVDCQKDAVLTAEYSPDVVISLVSQASVITGRRPFVEKMM